MMDADMGSLDRQAPLAPVTTRWDARESGADSGDAGNIILPPFAAGRNVAPVEPPAVVRMFDSEPIADPTDGITPFPEPEPGHAAAQQDAEPWMPWQEEPSAEVHESGPAVTSEEAAEPDSRGLDDWETALDDDDGGRAMPAWGEEESQRDRAADATVEAADELFPLDAFIIPPDSKRLPAGLEHAEGLHVEVAEKLAQRLEQVAGRLRTEGFAGLLQHNDTQEPIDTLLAGVLAGYLAQHTNR